MTPDQAIEFGLRVGTEARLEWLGDALTVVIERPNLHPMIIYPKEDPDVAQQLQPNGKWSPSIPLPLYGWFMKLCLCRKRFWTTASYERHYLTKHVRQERP